jgi:hypothetical protein
MRVPVGVDISETWEVDFCAAAGRDSVDAWRAVLSAAGDDAAKRLAAEQALAAAEDELESYEVGSGPVIIVGHIPGAKRAEIAGMMQDAEGASSARERLPAEQAWRREVVRWAVRGHRGLRRRDGAEQPFEGTSVTIAGETFTQPTERQIERYVQAGMLADLAHVALTRQGLTGAEKNG